MTCGYEGRHFGAAYPDATCIDGYLWDLDSFEDGCLTSGGDIPCPQCNLKAWLESLIDTYQNDFSDVDSFEEQSLHHFNKAIVWALEFHPPQTLIAQLDELAPWLPYWKEGEDTYEENTVNLVWPWPITHPNLTSHTSLALRSSARPPVGAVNHNSFWLVPAS